MQKVGGEKYLYERNGIYYFRVTIPSQYLEHFGKSELKESLRTSYKRDAIIKLCAKTAEYNSKLKSIDDENTQIISLIKNNRNVSRAGLERIVLNWFSEQIKMQNIRLQARKHGKEEILEEVQGVKNVLTDAYINAEPVKLQTTWVIEDIIEKNNLAFDKEPENRGYLSELVSRGQLELARRNVDELNGQPGTCHDTEMFGQERFKNDQFNSTNSVTTLGELVEAYENDPQHQNWAPKTMPGYQSIHRLIIEFFGTDRDANSINREDARRYREMILQYPRDATKKYGGLPLQQRIKKAKSEGAKLLSAYSKNQYIRRLSALLKWGEREEYVTRNPAVGLAIIDDTPDDEKRDRFEVSDLRTMFSSTIYTGRQRGIHGIYKPGDLVIRDSRYWIPLMAVLNGARLNEMAQIRTSAIVEVEGIHCFSFTKQSDDQRFKNVQSRRIVPIHPDLIRMGFLDFVQSKRDEGSDRLFPEVTPDKYGYYSGKLSKNFGYWLEKIGVKADDNCFHSFRHTFKDGLLDADIPPEIQERLGGWSDDSGKKSSRKNYGRGHGIKKLYDNIRKLKYPGLDLSHLYKN
ncbi:MAG: site-specific integrase [Kordiimonadaceae bacterium]|nr:site-specific integrase [Kordiimonadaceae bacterium]